MVSGVRHFGRNGGAVGSCRRFVNHTYRLVWNEATQRYVPAAEGTRARRKSGGCKALKRLGTVILAAALGSNYVGTAVAAPTGGAVATGQGTISQSGTTTTVSQQSQNLSLNWAGFSIAAGETVRFVQPSSTAVALNRVTGSDPSQIYGQLQANGQVFLINPNGVLFKPGAEVNVGALVASTLNLSDADFQAGHYQFTAGSTTGTVDNQGHLTAAAGGYLALLGPTVSNNGSHEGHERHRAAGSRQQGQSATQQRLAAVLFDRPGRVERIGGKQSADSSRRRTRLLERPGCELGEQGRCQ